MRAQVDYPRRWTRLTATPPMQLNRQRKSSHDGDSWGAPYSHGLDAVESLLAGGNLIVVALMGQAELVQHVKTSPGVFDGLKSGHLIFLGYNERTVREVG